MGKSVPDERDPASFEIPANTATMATGGAASEHDRLAKAGEIL